MNTIFFTTFRRASHGVLGVITAALALHSASAQPASLVPATPAPGAPPAQDGGRGVRGGGNNNTPPRGANFGGGLNFDEKQRELLQAARLVHADELRKLNDRLADAQKEFVKAVVAEKYDETVVKSKADAIGKIQAEILALNGLAFATVSPTLKPEQRESLEGNARIGLAIISPTAGFGGPGGAIGGGRGNFGAGAGGPGAPGGPDAGGADRAVRRGGDRGTPGVPGAPVGGNTRQRDGDNQGQ